MGEKHKTENSALIGTFYFANKNKKNKKIFLLELSCETNWNNFIVAADARCWDTVPTCNRIKHKIKALYYCETLRLQDGYLIVGTILEKKGFKLVLQLSP